MTPPEILYKYRSLDGPSRDWTIRTIACNEIWFSSLAEFNDPFECRVTITMTGDAKDWAREFPGTVMPGEPTIRKMIPELEEGVRKDAESIGMFCLSSRNDDILMWS